MSCQVRDAMVPLTQQHKMSMPAARLRGLHAWPPVPMHRHDCSLTGHNHHPLGVACHAGVLLALHGTLCICDTDPPSPANL